MRALLILIFAASGFAGLVYESVWSHYLRILVGAAAYAQSLVLAVFMGGMALGAWLVSRHTERWGRLLRGYALLEGLIGLLALGFHPAFVVLQGVLFDSGLFAGFSPEALRFATWAAAVLLILPSAVLLGMTFPLMSGGLIRKYPEEPGESLALLYFANALGGAVGVLASGFFFVRWWGLPGAMVAAGVLNLILAGYVWRRVGSEAEPKSDVAPSAPGAVGDARLGASAARWLLLVAGLTGLASFVYEIAWIRMLSLVLSSSTHAFELMLSAFILGIALGGLWIHRRIDRLDSPIRFLAHVQIAMGVLAVATLPVYRGLFAFMDGLLLNLPPTEVGYAVFSFFSHGMALSVMLPATFCAGMTLPLVTLILMRDGGGGERSIGRVYAWNTVGAVAGALLALHIGLPVLGLKGTLALGAGLDVAVGLGLLWLMCPAPERSRPMLVSGGALAAVMAIPLLVSLDPVILSTGVYRRIVDTASYEGASISQYRDGRTATISVMDHLGVRSIRTNGKPASSMTTASDLPPTGDEITGTLLGAYPVLLKPEARSALNIGMGSGFTSHVLLASHTLESVTTVEIEPAIVELASAFSPRNSRVFEDPRSRIVIEDARTFLASSGEDFDVIVAQPSNPWVSGTSALYSREFYGLAVGSLAPGGVLVQWIQLSAIHPERVVSILEAVRTSFPYFDVYAGDGDLIVVGTADEPPPRIGNEVLVSPVLLQELSLIEVRSPQDLQVRLAGTQRTVGPLAELYDARPNSDFRPKLDQLAARDRFMRLDAAELLRFYVQPFPVLELLGETSPSWDRTAVTPSDLFFYSTRVRVAMAFRDLVADTDALPPQSGGPVHLAWAHARGLLQECANATNPDEAAAALHVVATAIITDLRPSELDTVWAALATLPCMELMKGEGEAWTRLYRAVGARNIETVVAVGEGILEAGSVGQLRGARLRYLVASVMTAHIGLGDAETALDRWATYRSRMFAGDADDTFFRQLAALAGMERRGELRR
ncbi:MAG TPA: fused MFS/spermidine synthase [Longimicrobiales bacterium]|nr:fused MFS/spermidine synthase [Longimicrobiales bacterium]